MPKIRYTYDFSKQQDVLAAHEKDAAVDVGVQVLHVDALDRVLEDEICWGPARQQRFNQHLIHAPRMSVFANRQAGVEALPN